MTAANSPDTPCVHWLTAVLYFGHGSKNPSWLARIANVSELVDSQSQNRSSAYVVESNSTDAMISRLELNFPTNDCSLRKYYITLQYNCLNQKVMR